tara:strand:+ start:2248 stop:2481 length:234 start_codon:yes stop_codon:yes gene_type:complete
MVDFDKNMSEDDREDVIRTMNENWIKTDDEIAIVYGEGMTRAKLIEEKEKTTREYQEFLKKLRRDVMQLREEKKNGS